MRRLLPLFPLCMAVSGAAASDPPAPMSAAECEVWARELSFAQSVADRDAEAFAAHLHPHAAFGVSGGRPTRGRDAIAGEWAGLIEGKRVRLRWYPARVTIAGEPDIAYSTGPALYESTAADADPRYRIGAFQSVWHKGEDGVWRVLFDDGIAPRPATEADAKAFADARVSACPQG